MADIVSLGINFGVKFDSLPAKILPNVPARAEFPCMRTLPVYVQGVLPWHVAPTAENARLGLMKRVLGNIKWDRRLMSLFRHFVGRWLKTNLVPIQDVVVETLPEAFESWLLTTTYSNKRKRQLREALQKYISQNDVTGFSKVKSFIKDEFYNEPKLARLINPRNDASKTLFGPLIKKIENEVYKLRYFVKHVPICERPQLFLDSWPQGTRCLTSDFSRFEGSFSPAFMRACEFQLYKYMLPSHREEMELYCKILGSNNYLVGSGCSAKIRGKRMSGDMCTSLGNGFSNLMLIMFMAWRSHVNIDGFVEGDDGLYFGDIAALDMSVITGLGFEIKMLVDSDPGRAGFCGMIYDLKNGVVLGDPKRHLLHSGWVTGKYVKLKKFDLELLRAKAFSLAFSFPACPVIASFSKYLLRVTDGVEPLFAKDYWTQSLVRMNMPNGKLSDRCIALMKRPVDDNSRLLLAESYGILPAQQIECEHYLDGLTALQPLSQQFTDSLFELGDLRRSAWNMLLCEEGHSRC